MSKNTHMTHLEDAVFLLGVNGTRQSINFLRQLRDTLNGHSMTKLRTSVKWDGAPAIFLGKHPETGKFFVAKKSLFNKTPLFYSSVQEIQQTSDLSAELKGKFIEAFNGYKDAGIPNIIQGDFLWENKDLKVENINDEEVVTFHPNTIVYSVPKNSDLGKKILASKFGIVFHTTYTGSSIESLSASYGVTMPKEPADGVQFDAMYKDVSGSASLTASESKTLARQLNTAGTHFQRISRSTMNTINDEVISKFAMTYTNSFVRNRRTPTPREMAAGFRVYMKAYYDKEIQSKKTPRGKENVKRRLDPVMKSLARVNNQQMLHVFTLYISLQQAKNTLVNKLNNASFVKTFLKTQNGWEVTGQEGFVAIDKSGRNAVKLVDRLEFSYANFSPDIIKGWQSDLRR